MAIFNLQDRTINAKIVYCGPARGGKTTSLKAVHAVLDPERKIELISLNTEADRTLFFDFLPISLGSIGGFSVKLQAFTVPGQVKYNLTRKYVLTGADAVIFVVDSTQEKLEDDLRSFENLDENLLANGINPNEIPIVLQYNKRDLGGTVPIEELEERFNRRGLTSFSTVAINGEGNFEAFTELAVETLDRLSRTHLGTKKSHGIAHALRERLQDQFRLVHPERSFQVPVFQRALPTSSESALGPDGESIEQLKEQLAERDRAADDRSEELAVLATAATAIAASDDPTSALVEAATRACGSDFGSIVYPVEGGGWAERDVRGFPEDPLARIGRGLILDQLATGEPFLLSRDASPDVLVRIREIESSLRGAAGVPIAGDRFGSGAYLIVYAVAETGESLRPRLPFLGALAAQAAYFPADDGTRSEAGALPLPLIDQAEAAVDAASPEPAELAAARGTAAAWEERAQLEAEFLAEFAADLGRPVEEVRRRLAALRATDEDPADAADLREIRAGLGSIDQGLASVARRLGDLKDLVAIQNGDVVWRPEPVGLRPLLREVFEAHKHEILDRRVRVKIRQGAQAPVASADSRWLPRVLDALIANAVRWSPRGGLVELAFEEGTDRVVMSVRDEGPGIPTVVRDRLLALWKEAYQLPSGTPMPRTGLGLPLAAAIVTAQGGRLWLGGEPGEGTIAYVDLPSAVEPSPTSAEV